MNISEKFNLNKTQRELDFIDIDIEKDTPLFVDPYFISTRPDPWSVDAHRTMESFFQFVLKLYDAKQIESAKRLFENLKEPNETCLGISSNKPKGKGVGINEAAMIFGDLLESRALDEELVRHVEDLGVFVDNVGKDKISDLVTNVIRKHLIEYTIEQCLLNNIELTDNVPTGYFWNAVEKRWDNSFSKMLVIDEKIIILVPKWIVSFSFKYLSDYYCRHYVLNYLQNEHIRMNSSLVRRRKLKSGQEKVWAVKKEIAKDEGAFRKEYIREFTKNHPDSFSDFRKNVSKKIKSVSNQQLDTITIDEEKDFIEYLKKRLLEIPSGRDNANEYHKFITGIMSFIFYPKLTRPIVEDEIHEGRKRIDITFDNSATDGFFHNLHNVKQIPCQYIFVECKNYSREVNNPELDQLAGRFSPNRGKFGFLVFRETFDLDYLLKKCSDAYNDSRGCLMPLVDSDFIFLLNKISEGDIYEFENLLSNRLRKIILN